MTQAISLAKRFCWLVHKDLLREFHAPRTWTAMLLLGLVMVLAFQLQLDLPEKTSQLAGAGLVWLAVFFAGTLTLERSFRDELDDGCWDALLSYPISPALIFLAKATFNFIGLLCLAAVLLATFAVLSGAPLVAHPLATISIAVLASVAISAVGTLVAGMTNLIRRRGHLLMLLLLPLGVPVLLAATSATRMTIAGEFDDSFYRWLQLLAAFAVIYLTAGVLFFEHVTES